VSFSGHFTSMYCSVTANVSNSTTTFTLRLNGADTTLTCTIVNGTRKGNTTGASVAFSTGDLIDVQVGTTNPNSPISVAVGVGP